MTIVRQHISSISFTLSLLVFVILFQSPAQTQTIEPITGDAESYLGYDYSLFPDSLSNNLIVEPPDAGVWTDPAGFVIHGTSGEMYHVRFFLPPKLEALSSEAHCAAESIRISFDSRSGYQRSAHLYFNPTDDYSFVMNAAGIDTLIVGFNASFSSSIWDVQGEYSIGVDISEGESSVVVHDSTFYEITASPYGDIGIGADMSLEGLARGHTYTLEPSTSDVASISPRMTGIEKGVSGKVDIYSGCGRDTMLLSFVLPKFLYRTDPNSHGDLIQCTFSDQSLYLKELNEYRNPKVPNTASSGSTPFVKFVLGITVKVPSSIQTGVYEGEALATAQYTGLKISPDHLSRTMQIPQPIHILAEVVESKSPESLALLPNFPNPFNGSTSIRYFLPAFGEVDLSVYNLLGQRLATLVHDRVSEGFHTATWEGSGYASGIYICRMSSGGHFATQRIVIVR